MVYKLVLVGYLFYFFDLIFIEVYLLYNAVLVSTAQQSESAAHAHTSPLFRISFPFRSPRSTEQSLCTQEIVVTYLFYAQYQRFAHVNLSLSSSPLPTFPPG